MPDAEVVPGLQLFGEEPNGASKRTAWTSLISNWRSQASRTVNRILLAEQCASLPSVSVGIWGRRNRYAAFVCPDNNSVAAFYRPRWGLSNSGSYEEKKITSPSRGFEV
jgi:hypothetical protein